MAFWVEKAMIIGFPLRSRPGFGVGTVLASPARSDAGRDFYSAMRRVKAGDVILHLTDNRAFTGFSRATGGYEEFSLGEELWYRVALADYYALAPTLDRNVFFDGAYGARLLEIVRETAGLNSFYERRLRLRQGAYLTQLATSVRLVLDSAYSQLAGKSLSDLIGQQLGEVAEI
jgi:hypothetical protein